MTLFKQERGRFKQEKPPLGKKRIHFIIVQPLTNVPWVPRLFVEVLQRTPELQSTTCSVFEFEQVDEACNGEDLTEVFAQITDVNVVSSGFGNLQHSEEDS